MDKPVIPVIIVDYDPEWPEVFARLKEVIGQELADLVITIEHVGSTSVPGLAAKPIIDLDVVIESREYLPVIIERLRRLGYSHRGDLGITGREAFDRAGKDVPWDGKTSEWLVHHLYVCAKDSEELARHRIFRDYLRKHPEAVQAYGDLKRELAGRFRYDRVAYTEAKTEFIIGLLSQAKEEE